MKKIVLLFLAIFSLIITGCSNNDTNTQVQNDLLSNFKLNIASNLEGNSIQIEKYDVIKLKIEITGKESQVVEWYPGDNTTIALNLSIGSYNLAVTHYCRNQNGQSISIIEEANFQVRLMKVVVIKITPGVAGIVNIGDENNSDPSSDNPPTLQELQSKIVGSWIGTVTTPWTSAYQVEITFNDDGTYSAKSLNSSIPAFYYGTDDDSPLKTYSIYDLYASGEGVGRIGIYFDTGSLCTGRLDFIKFTDDDTLSFEFWHRGTYGPVIFELTRECI